MKKGWVRKERKEKGEIYWGRDRGKGKKREKWNEEGTGGEREWFGDRKGKRGWLRKREGKDREKG